MQLSFIVLYNNLPKNLELEFNNKKDGIEKRTIILKAGFLLLTFRSTSALQHPFKLSIVALPFLASLRKHFFFIFVNFFEELKISYYAAALAIISPHISEGKGLYRLLHYHKLSKLISILQFL